MKPGDRVSFDDPYDGLSTGIVTEVIVQNAIELVAFVQWDDGTPESGIFVDQLALRTDDDDET